MNWKRRSGSCCFFYKQWLSSTPPFFNHPVISSWDRRGTVGVGQGRWWGLGWRCCNFRETLLQVNELKFWMFPYEIRQVRLRWNTDRLQRTTASILWCPVCWECRGAVSLKRLTHSHKLQQLKKQRFHIICFLVHWNNSVHISVTFHVM